MGEEMRGEGTQKNRQAVSEAVEEKSREEAQA